MSVIPSAFTFRKPLLNEITNGNSESFQFCSPLNSTSGIYPSDNNSVISFNIASSKFWWKNTRTILSFNVVPRDSQGNEVVAAGTLNSEIPTSCFSAVRLLVGGVEIYSNRNYPMSLAMYYSTAPQTKKDFLKMSEGYGVTDAFKTGRRRFHHALALSFLATESTVPLPVLTSGCTLELTVGNVSGLFRSNNVNKFTIENPTLLYQAVEVAPALQLRVMGALESGRSLSLPFCKEKTSLYYGSGGVDQLLSVPVGNISSVQSITICYRRQEDVVDQTKDKAAIYGHNNLRSVRIEAAGLVMPTTRGFSFASGDGGDVPYDPEITILGLMTASGNIYNASEEFSIPQGYDDKYFRIHISYKSSAASGEAFGDGLNMEAAASQNINIFLSHSQPVATTTSIYVSVVTDAILEVKRDWVVPVEVFRA